MLIENTSEPNLSKKKEITIENFIRLKPGALSNEYQMKKKISKATFGDVYLVYHKITKSIRCLKVYNKEKMVNTNQNRFEEELQIIKELDHPNIFQIFEFYKDEENYYLITEYLEGGELFDFISTSKNLNEQTVFVIMEQILSAVNYLHKHNIIHRDLKPENLLLTRKNDCTSIKLIDFGTSKKFQKGDIFNVPLGTCYYIAPEVIRRQYNEKADIWSCGIILYILLCGYPPFNGNSDLEIYKNILQQKLVFDNNDWKNVSKEAKDLVNKMLDKYPLERYDMKQVLSHDWFVRNREITQFCSKEIEKNILTSIKKFTIKNKFEKVLRIFLVQYHDMKEERDKLVRFFKKLDKNHDGMISADEFKEALTSNNFNFDVKSFLAIVDVNKDEQINYSEFLMATYDFKNNLTSEMIENIFNIIDDDRNGYLTPEEIQKFLNLKDNDPLLLEIINEADKNNDNMVSFEEFTKCIENIFDLMSN